jgi:23S rRNA pseudouridine2605 synthase
MRINVFIAQATGLSRRAADQAVLERRVAIDGRPAQAGDQVSDTDRVTLDGQPIESTSGTTTIMLNKPVGYVVSRDGQGSQTVYDLLPPEYHRLKPVGRLDKDSSGLLLLADDGQLANQLTHPRYSKTKIYEVSLDKPLDDADRRAIERGIKLEDGPSALQLKAREAGQRDWQVTMSEGRNRQIRRTFAALGYTVTKLHRINFGDYGLDNALKSGQWQVVS